jgi:cytochrome c oxidase assembly protein COX15 homolog
MTNFNCLNQQATINKQMVFFRKCTHSLCGLVFLTALSGALVAGLDAGLVYNSWPKMADKWIPDDLLVKSPIWKNLFENPTMVQFDHRHLGELVATFTLFAWFYSRRLPLNPRTRLALNCLVATAVGQIGLGIVVLLFYVPKHLAVLHQGGALTLLSTALWVMHELKLVRYVPK